MPSDAEVKALTDLYLSNKEEFNKDRDGARKMALVLGLPKPDLDSVELAAWMVVANVLLNLDETITKG